MILSKRDHQMDYTVDFSHDDPFEKPWTTKFTDVTSTTVSENTTDDSHASDIALATIAVFMAVAGLGSNLCVFVAIGSVRRLRRINNILIVSLAAADFLRAIASLFMFFSFKMDTLHQETACALYNAIHVSLETASIFHIVVVNAERAFVISIPLVYQRLINRRKVVAFVALLWAASFTYGLPQIIWIKQNTTDLEYCYPKLGLGFAVFDFIFRFISPLILILLTNLKIFYVVHSQMLRIRPNVRSDIEDSDCTTYHAMPNSGPSTPRRQANSAENIRKLDQSIQTDPLPPRSKQPNLQVSSHSQSRVTSFSQSAYEMDGMPNMTNDKHITMTTPHSDLDAISHENINISQHPQERIYDKETGETTSSSSPRLSGDKASFNEASHHSKSETQVQTELSEDIMKNPQHNPAKASTSAAYSETRSSKSPSKEGESNRAMNRIKSLPIMKVLHENIKAKEITTASDMEPQITSALRRTSTGNIPSTKRGSVTFRLGDDHQDIEHKITALPRIEAVLIDDDTTISGDMATTETTISSFCGRSSLHPEPSEDPQTGIWTTCRCHCKGSYDLFQATSSTEAQIRRHSTSSNNSTTSLRRRATASLSNNKAVKLTLTLVITFLAGYLPYRASHMMLMICGTCMPLVAVKVTCLIAFSTCLVNPFVYNFYSNEFRAAVKSTFSWFGRE